MWNDRLEEKTIAFKVFSFVRDCNTAVFASEVMEKFPELNKHTIWTCLCNLSERNLIVRNEELVKTPNGGTAQLYGINQAVISKRKIQLTEDMKQSPDKFTHGKLKASVLKVMKEAETGLTPAESAERIGVSQHTVSNTLIKLFRKGLVNRSPFPIPNKISGITGNMTHVYGIDNKQVFHGISRLMPPAVRAAFIQIMNSDKIWPGWELTKRTKIDNYNLVQWFKKGMCILGLIKYRTTGNLTYYYNHALPEIVVENQLAQLREESKRWRLNITTLGRMFQKRAVFTYVEYMKTKGFDIKTNPEFPDMIPSWLTQKTREKYQTKIKDENNYVWTDYSNDVWTFDSDPVDYIVFVRDKTTGAKNVHVLTCKRDISKRFGVNYYTTFVGAVKMGRTKKGHDIPGFLTAQPVFICSETYGGKLHTFNNDSKGQAGIIITMETMNKMLALTGKTYPHEEEFKLMVERNEGLNLYSNHIDVLTGQKTVFDLLKERGLYNDR